jgi:hypothetical protein
MPTVHDDRPNLLAAAVLAFALGALLLGLSLYGKFRGEETDSGALLLGAALLVAGVAALEQHKRLKAMTPEERDRYWARKDAEWRATADAHARARLGRDYDKK